MNLKWSNLFSIANSRVVKSSVIWLFVVPLCAKLLLQVEYPLTFLAFGQKQSISISLPFSWQLLFYAAIFFTIAGIIYSIYCPELVKKYKNYPQFEADGKTRLQINSALRDIVWCHNKNIFKSEYLTISNKYFRSFGPLTPGDNEQSMVGFGVDCFDKVTNIRGLNSNAFYFVYDLSDKKYPFFIGVSLVLYVLGFISLGLIAIENNIYVIGTNF